MQVDYARVFVAQHSPELHAQLFRPHSPEERVEGLMLGSDSIIGTFLRKQDPNHFDPEGKVAAQDA